MDIPRGWGSQRPKFLKESMKQKWNFQGVGVQTKNSLWEGCGYFLEQHIIIKFVLIS